MSDRLYSIRSRLEQKLEPLSLQIIDDSHKHAGHAGARQGGGHYTVEIISPRFEGLALLQRHRLVYEALEQLMGNDIHALSIHAYTPQEKPINFN